MWAMALALRGAMFPWKSFRFVPSPLSFDTCVVYVGPALGPQGPYVPKEEFKVVPFPLSIDKSVAMWALVLGP